MVAVVPREQAEIIDNWRVAGLRGSGSFDFRLDEAFVPASRTFERAASACRGGALFSVEAHVFLSNELPPLMVGMARRALEEMTGLADQTARFPGGATLAERAVFHAEFGRAEASIRAARAVHRDAVASTWEAARTGRQPSASDHMALTTASVFAAETAADVISGLFRFGGGRLLAPPSSCSGCCSTCSPPVSTSGSARRPTSGPAGSASSTGNSSAPPLLWCMQTHTN
jgi:indole-3-acetate monooxygenase